MADDFPNCDHPECEVQSIVKINERHACADHCDWALEPIPKPTDLLRMAQAHGASIR